MKFWKRKPCTHDGAVRVGGTLYCPDCHAVRQFGVADWTPRRIEQATANPGEMR